MKKHTKVLGLIVPFVLLVVLLGVRNTSVVADTNNFTLVPEVTLISTNPLGESANGFSSGIGISSNGRYVVFSTYATDITSDITSDPTGGVYNVYWKDLQTGETLMVSKTYDGSDPDGSSVAGSMSADGMKVAFGSDNSKLIPNDGNLWNDIFVWDRATESIERVSVNSQEQPGNSYSSAFNISADGTTVVFTSLATNLVPFDENGYEDVFLRDLVAGTTQRISQDFEGYGGNAPSWYPSVDASGQVVVFSTMAALRMEDSNGWEDVYMMDRSSLIPVLLTVDTSGGPTNGASTWPQISPNGRYVTFHSGATDLVANDLNGKQDVFRLDLQTGEMALMSVTANGTQASYHIRPNSSVNDSGDVAFYTSASNLVPGDTNGEWDVIVRLESTGELYLMSSTPAMVSGNDDSRSPAYLTNNGIVAFESKASDLVPNDFNGTSDVFIAQLITVTQQITVSGQILDGLGLPISGVSIDYGIGTVITDDFGNYEIILENPGCYELQPAKEGIVFDPPTVQVVLPPNAQGVNFIGQPMEPDLYEYFLPIMIR